jgi:hypothetical protein
MPITRNSRIGPTRIAGALDGAGTAVGGRYNHNDGRDDSRDLIAFYSREEGDNYYFRVDLYDLALGAETGSLDIYVAIDCAFGGQAWMPDFTDVQVDPNHAYEVCIKLYDTFNHDVIDSGFNSIGGFVGAYYNSEIDAVEFGISRQTLINQGWNGSSVMYFTVMTVRDGSNGGAGEISGGSGTTSDATDTFFDDGRGFDDGVINGAIASNAGTGRAKYASIAHGNQSINQAEALRVHIYDPPTFNKTGFIRTLDTHEIFNVPINLHLSGSLIVASRWAEAAPGDDPLTDGPAFLNRVAEFVNADQQDGKPGSLIGGVFAEHIMPYFEGAANASSIQLFNELMLNEFGLTPADVPVMHTPERVIRSNSTGLSPLDGHTFEDIVASPYTATYLDEITHMHWWFYPGDPWSGANGSFDAPHQHKIHLINGVYCFMINDREDQSKFGPHDGGMALDTRFRAGGQGVAGGSGPTHPHFRRLGGAGWQELRPRARHLGGEQQPMAVSADDSLGSQPSLDRNRQPGRHSRPGHRCWEFTIRCGLGDRSGVQLLAEHADL